MKEATVLDKEEENTKHLNLHLDLGNKLIS